MRKNRSSLTATGIAIVRAVESEKPVDQRICYDPLARQFVPAWMYRFLAEGVFMYFEGVQVKSLVLTLHDRFPGAELVFDAYSPIHNWVSNLQTARFGFRTHWGIWHGQELESWGNASPTGAGIQLLDEWGFLDESESRLAHFRWLRPIESLFRTLRIYHFRLGEVAETNE